MADIVDTPEEAAAEQLAPLIVRRPLEAFLDGHDLGEGELEVERIGEGHSNVTYLCRRGGARFVLRRPPRPPLPPSAHDVLREARLLKALEQTEVRTPAVLAACDDESLLGVPFYVMEEKHGDVITFEVPEALDSPEQRHRIGEELIDELAAIHAVDWQAVGLEGYGKPTGYLERQLRRFNGLWEHNKTRDVPLVQEVAAWLAANLPEEQPATIVHGDYRLGNTMFAPGAPATLEAVFDWELSTIGDPLADVGYITVTWVEAGDPEDNMFRLSPVTAREGFPTRDELMQRYEEKTGRSMTDLRWYQAISLWKAAVFMEGNLKRAQAGTVDDPYLKLFDVGVPQLAESALAITRGEEPVR